MPETDTADSDQEHFSPAERERLVRLCARLSGSTEAAEDLAQETLLEAWRARDRLRDPSLRSPWLAGIARNVCRRRHFQPDRGIRPAASTVTLQDIELHFGEGIGLDVALERSEVADLLGHALGLLPASARDLLIERYVDDLPVGEIAAQRGLSEGTAAVRLHRGRRALRRILWTDLRDEAVALGLLDGASEEWQATRIWCPCCGRARLQAQRTLAVQVFTVRCPTCGHRTIERAAGYLEQVSGYWRSLLHVYRESERYYRAALASGSPLCACCARVARLQYSLPRTVTGRDHDLPGVSVRCDGCGAVSMQPDVGLALTHPVVQQFWRRHKRMRLAGRRELMSAGRDAILIRFESVTNEAAAEVVAAADNFEVLHVVASGIEE